MNGLNESIFESNMRRRERDGERERNQTEKNCCREFQHRHAQAPDT